MKKIIGIMSCKGGVGKSTVSVNLSVFIASFFFKKVGLLDADIYGPNHKQLLGIMNKKIKTEKEKIFPIKKYNISSMSFGYFLEESSAVLLRGPMASNTINYLYKNTIWGELDFLFIDFPPGTGDIHLSILRDINFYGIYLVTIPNIMSIEDIKKSFVMLKKFNVNILGIIENMSEYECVKCEHVEKVYSNKNYSDFYKNELKISNIYKLQINSYISKSSENGIPFVFYEFGKKYNFIFKKIYDFLN